MDAGVFLPEAMAWFRERQFAHTLAVIGTSKNAGKTTIFNYILELLTTTPGRPDGQATGILSLGVDGERQDALYGIDKPAIMVPPGVLVCTAAGALPENRRAGFARVVDCDLSTPLGPLGVYRAVKPGRVLLAGVARKANAQRAIAAMRAAGAGPVLLDGAFDRIAAADPGLADGVWLATGMSCAAGLDAVVERTAFFLERLTPARAPPGTPETHEVLTAAVLDAWRPNDPALVVRDPSRVVVPQGAWVRWRARGGRWQALAWAPLVGVSVNPVDVETMGSLPGAGLMRRVAALCPGIRVCDVVAGQSHVEA